MKRLPAGGGPGAPGCAAFALLATMLAISCRPSQEGGGSRSSERVVPVRAAAVERGTIEIYAQYPGELVGEAVNLAPKVSGRIEEVRVRIGDPVRSGEELVVIDDTDLARQLEEARGQLGVATAQVSRSRAQLEEAEADFERSKELFEQEVLSSQEFDRLRARRGAALADVESARAQVAQSEARVELLGQQLADTRLLAPFDGRVAGRYLDPGAFVQPGTPVLRLVQGGPLLVQFRVPERDLGRLVEGHPLTLSTQATGDRTYAGHVERISGEVERSDRTVLVEGMLDETPPVLRPGMYTSVEVRLERLEQVKIVPGVAVLERMQADGRLVTGLFGVDAEGRTVWTEVEVLGRQGHLVAVEGNIEAGETVLTLGHEELGPGTPVDVVEGPEPSSPLSQPEESAP